MGASLNLPHSQKAPLRLVNQHGDDDHRADGDELPERFDIDEDETVLNDGDDERAGDRAPNGAGAAEQTGAADDHSGDGIEQQRSEGSKGQGPSGR